jgi:hypothetical protein
MKKYIGNAFSPMMLSQDNKLFAAIVEIHSLDQIPKDCISIVSHEVTAKVLSALLQKEIPFNRVNLELKVGNELFCIIPNFRANEAREFSYDEVNSYGYRIFHIKIYAD